MEPATVFEWQAAALFWEQEAQRFGDDCPEFEAVCREKANLCWRACADAARAELAVA